MSFSVCAAEERRVSPEKKGNASREHGIESFRRSQEHNIKKSFLRDNSYREMHVLEKR